MPELPEVETTLNGVKPFVNQQVITKIVVRERRMRWPVPDLDHLHGQRVARCERRAKYMLFHLQDGQVLLLHLGMSGNLRVLPQGTAVQKHDHIDIEFSNGKLIRFNDPRRFGCCLLIDPPILEHKLLSSLGPEPLSSSFDGEHLFTLSRGRSLAVKNFVMDGKVVVGVGNIYASEALYEAGIRPTMAAGRVSRARYTRLADCIKGVLAKAIKAGGTTLNDFIQADGKPGYFSQELQVYGRKDEPCYECAEPIKSKVIGQRNSYYCSQCQSF